MDTSKTSFKHILGIAYPIILGGLAENIINLTDTAFVGRLGEVQLGAVGIGGLYYYTYVLIAIGLAMGSQIIIGRRNGEKNYHGAGFLLDNSLYLFCFIGILLFAALQLLTGPMLKWLVSSKDVLSYANSYIHIRSYGVVFLSMLAAFRAFYIGITQTRIIILITALMAVVNIVLDYGLIFGKLGMPAMGVDGAAWASAIAEFCGFAGYVLFSTFNKHVKKFRLFSFPKPDFSSAVNILKVGTPLMLQSWVSISSWFVFFMLIEKMGERALAVSSIIKSAYLLFMIPVWGFASACNTLVSNAMGAERQFEVLQVVRKVCTLSAIVMLFFVIVNLLFPRLLLGVYTTDADVLNASVWPFWIISVALIVFSVSSVMFQAVSGTGATRVSLKIELFTIVVYFAYVLLVTQTYRLSLPYVWASELVYMGSMGIGSFFYLRSGRWKNIKL